MIHHLRPIDSNKSCTVLHRTRLCGEVIERVRLVERRARRRRENRSSARPTPPRRRRHPSLLPSTTPEAAAAACLVAAFPDEAAPPPAPVAPRRRRLAPGFAFSAVRRFAAAVVVPGPALVLLLFSAKKEGAGKSSALMYRVSTSGSREICRPRSMFGTVFSARAARETTKRVALRMGSVRRLQTEHTERMVRHGAHHRLRRRGFSS